jgi:hypothetical protein
MSATYKAALQIIDLPSDEREAAFASCQRRFEEYFMVGTIDDPSLGREWAALVDRLTRQLVTAIEMTGGAAGGHA